MGEMTDNGSMRMFKLSEEQKPVGAGEMEPSWSKEIVVVVLTVMKPSRFSRKSMLKAVFFTILLTVVSCFFLISFFAQPIHPLDISSSQTRISSRRKIRLTAKDGSKHKNLFYSSFVQNKSVHWNVSKYRHTGEVTPVCDINATLLIVITSAPENWDRRKEIRKSWCDPEMLGFHDKPWQCVFMIGQSENQTIGAHLIQESSQFGDILRGSYMDVYRNLTLKVIHGFDWATRACSHVRYILKTDDDCFVNIGHLYNFLVTKNTFLSGLYVGNVFSAEDKREVVRHPKSRWFVSKLDYPPEFYPRYASGTGYLMSFDVVERVVKMSPYVRPFPVEDAYVGYLMSRLGIEPILSSRFTLNANGWTVCNYLYLFVIHGMEPPDQRLTLDKAIRADKENCRISETGGSWS